MFNHLAIHLALVMALVGTCAGRGRRRKKLFTGAKTQADAAAKAQAELKPPLGLGLSVLCQRSLVGPSHRLLSEQMVHELWTVVTDAILAVESLVLGVLLWKVRGRSQCTLFWSLTMFSLTATALFGAIAHSFPPSSEVQAPIWLLTVLCVPLIALCMGLALLDFVKLEQLKGIVWIKFLIFIIIAVVKRDFFYGIIDYGSVTLIWIVASIRNKTLFIGVILTVVAAAIQQLRVGISASFNHNDLYHVVQMLALFFVYSGVRNIKN